MDPEATLDRLLKALEESDLTEAAQATRDLIAWTERGGFLPERARDLFVLRGVS